MSLLELGSSTVSTEWKFLRSFKYSFSCKKSHNCRTRPQSRSIGHHDRTSPHHFYRCDFNRTGLSIGYKIILNKIVLHLSHLNNFISFLCIVNVNSAAGNQTTTLVTRLLYLHPSSSPTFPPSFLPHRLQQNRSISDLQPTKLFLMEIILNLFLLGM